MAIVAQSDPHQNPPCPAAAEKAWLKEIGVPDLPLMSAEEKTAWLVECGTYPEGDGPPTPWDLSDVDQYAADIRADLGECA